MQIEGSNVHLKAKSRDLNGLRYKDTFESKKARFEWMKVKKHILK